VITCTVPKSRKIASIVPEQKSEGEVNALGLGVPVSLLMT
jgi:hypothetical protein